MTTKAHALAIAVALPVAVLPAQAGASDPASVDPGVNPAVATSVHTDLSEAHACLATGAGFAIATDGGLAMMSGDGKSQRSFTALDGLPGPRVRALLDDGEHMWLGTEGGVAHAEFSDGALHIARRFKSAPVTALLRHGDRLHVATWGDGVLVLKGDAPRFSPRLLPVEFAGKLRDQRKRRIRARATSLATHAGALHVGTAGSGVYRTDRDGRLHPLALDLGSRTVWSLASHRNALWIGTADGLYALAGGTLQRAGDGQIRALRVIGGQLFAARFGDGVFEVRPGKAGSAAGASLVRAARFPRGATMAYDLHARAGTACVATHGGVWLKTGTSATWQRAQLRAGPPSNDISALARDGDRLWVGTFDRGLGYYESGTWSTYAHPNIDLKINALAVEPARPINGDRKRVWIATSAGLSYIQGDRVMRLSKNDGLPTRNVLSLALLRGGGIIAGTTRGAVIVRGGRPVALGRKQGVSVGNVWSALEDSDGWLWLGTTKGLYRGKPGGEFVRFSVASGHLCDDWVMALASDGRRVWVGTYKGGVSRMDWSKDAGAADVTAVQLGSGWVNPGGLRYERGVLYAATMEGLFIGDGITTGWKRGEGAPGRDTTAVVAVADRIWIASRRGLVSRPGDGFW